MSTCVMHSLRRATLAGLPILLVLLCNEMMLFPFDIASLRSSLSRYRLSLWMHFEDTRVLDTHYPRAEYVPSKEASLESVVVKGLHYGQRKLLLSEIEFLSAVYEYGKKQGNECKPVLVVYAGAANGSHLPLLFELFPKTRFILVDPAPFCDEVKQVAIASNGPIVELVEDYCTDELCLRLSRSYEGKYDLFLVSDIRSGVPRRTQSNAEHTEMIMRDNEWQRSWCYSLRVQAAMLKFHPPYPAVTDTTSKGYDQNDKTPESIEYLDGRMMFGVWAPKSSSEVRLIVEGPFLQGYKAPLRWYSCTEHEEQCYHYNTNGRYMKDCAAEKTILDAYLTAFPETYSSATALSALISERLRFPQFLPLQNDFTEDKARWLHFVCSVRHPEAMVLFDEMKGIMTTEVVRDLVERYCSANVVPADAEVGGWKLPTTFWKSFCRGDFTEAYSFPKIRWKFFGPWLRRDASKLKRRR